MKALFAIIFIILLSGCIDNSDSGKSTKSEGEEPTSAEAPTVGYYPAKDGSGYSEFHDLIMPEDGYLDITTYRSSVSLHDENLGEIIGSLKSTDYIMAGNYKVKMSYTPTSNLPGNVTIFSLALTPYDLLPAIESKQYRAEGSFGTYSEYYKLNMSNGGYVDVTTARATVFVYNFTEYADSKLPLTEHYVSVNGNKYLDPGLYIVKFTYTATSLQPGSVSFLFNSN